jgi:hypothetical protein
MTCDNVRRRFADDRVEGLAERPRLGLPKADLD